MDRTKQLENEVERLKSAISGIHIYGSDTLSGRMDGPDDRDWQRAAVLEMTKRARAALTPSEKVPDPKCPKCGGELYVVVSGPNRDSWECCTLDCHYSQPDSAQRPKMPVAEAGMRVAEWRIPKLGDRYWCVAWVTATCEDKDYAGKCYWIAVKDAPVSEPVPVVRWWFYPMQNRYCKTVNDRIVEDSDPRWGLGGLILRLTWRQISEHEYLAAKKSEEAARKPAKPAIEPLAIEWSKADALTTIQDKINELIARVAALEGGGK